MPASAVKSKKVGRAKGQKAAPTVSGNSRAGIIFSPARCNRYLKQGRYSQRFGQSAGVFMAGVLEYLCAEVLDLAHQVCTEQKKKTLQPKHLNLAFRTDQELGLLMHHATFTSSSVPVNVHPFHLKGKAAKDHAAASQ